MARWSPLQWPVVRQVRSGDLLGRGPAGTSERTRNMAPRTSTADRVVQSVGPYCAVGCGQLIYVKGEEGGEVGRGVEAGEAGRGEGGGEVGRAGEGGGAWGGGGGGGSCAGGWRGGRLAERRRSSRSRVTLIPPSRAAGCAPRGRRASGWSTLPVPSPGGSTARPPPTS